MSTKQSGPANGLEQVRSLLEEGHVDKALDTLNKLKDRAPWAENARAVCLMRLGHPDRAISIYRSMLLINGVILRQDAPVVFVVNFATALLLAGNVSGALDMLNEAHQPDHPSVARVRVAIDRWRKSLGFFQRLAFAAGTTPDKPVPLDFPPGEV